MGYPRRTPRTALHTPVCFHILLTSFQFQFSLSAVNLGIYLNVQNPVLLWYVFTPQGPELHMNVSAKQEPELHQDIFRLQEPV
jgi:hypothetical protein